MTPTQTSTTAGIEAGDGWRDWPGGKCPVPADTLVDVRFRNGVCEYGSRADEWRWNHIKAYWDIIAYRLSQPTPEPEASAEGVKPVAYVDEKGDVAVPAWGPIKALMDALPAPSFGSKLLPLFARRSPAPGTVVGVPGTLSERARVAKQLGTRPAPYAFCCNSSPEICDCVNKDHGIAYFEPTKAEVDAAMLAASPSPPPAAKVPTEGEVEAAARRIAISQGQDPDEDCPTGTMCDDLNWPVAWWRVFEEHARAALSSSREG